MTGQNQLREISIAVQATGQSQITRDDLKRILLEHGLMNETTIRAYISAMALQGTLIKTANQKIFGVKQKENEQQTA